MSLLYLVFVWNYNVNHVKTIHYINAVEVAIFCPLCTANSVK